MSVLVKGMGMPEKCGSCDLFHAEYPMHCSVVKGHKTVGAPYGMPRPEWCPLVELPETHGRLIDADATMKRWGLDKATKYGNETAEQQHYSYSTMMMYEIVDILDDAPVVIEAEDEE